MIDIFSFTLGAVFGFALGTAVIYYWIKNYVSKLLKDKDQILKNIMDILESKRK